MADLIVDGTTAAESLTGGTGNDTISGYGGADTLSGLDGNDSISGGDANDIVYGGNGADTLTDGAGNDVLYGGFGADVYLWSGLGNESFIDSGLVETSLLRLTTLNPIDVTYTGNGPYSVGVKGTSYWVSLQSGQYTIEFANGVVWTPSQAADIAATGATSAAGAPILGTTGGESLSGTSLGEFVLAYGGADTVDGGAGNDVLYGHDGADSLVGGDGNDTAYGGADNGADTFAGGAGNDILYGQFGADVYVWGTGLGNDSFVDSGAVEGDVVRLTNLNSGQVTLTGTGPRTLGVRGTSETASLQSGSYSIEFANGEIWSPTNVADIATLGATSAAGGPLVGNNTAETINGTSLGEFVLAYGGADIVDGGDGNDGLYGYDGADSLVGGAGNDTLDGANDADTLAGGTGADIVRGGAGADVYIWGTGLGSDSLVDNGAIENNIVRLINLNPGDVTLTGTGPRTLGVRGTSETLSLQSGNYSIEFANGVVWSPTHIADIVSTGATTAPGGPIIGADTGEAITGTGVGEFILAYGGDDTLDGGDGNDGLYGYDGADSLVGGAGNDTLDGGNGADTMAGGTGADIVRGGAGADVYIWGTGLGSDSLVDNGAIENNIVRLINLNPGDVTLTGTGPRTLGVRGTSETLSLQSGNYSIEFANGVVWSPTHIADIVSTGATTAPGGPIIGADTGEAITGTGVGEFILAYGGDDTLDGGDGNDGLYGYDGADSLVGGAGNDTLDGGNGADTMAGGTGNDVVRGGAAADVYIWGTGQGSDSFVDNGAADTSLVRLTNLNPGDVTLTGSGPRTLGVRATSETASLQSGTYSIEFANGVVWNATHVADIASLGATTAPGGPIIGADTGEAITGTGVGEFILAYGGDDTLDGGDGNDGLYGYDGADSLVGGAGNDTLNGGNGADTFVGGAGNDVVYGGAGAEVYVWGSGQGSDVLIDNGAAETSLVRLTNLNPADVSLTGSGPRTLGVKATGETLSLQSGTYTIEFANGVIWTPTNVADIASTGATSVAGAPILGTAGGESLSGTSDPEYVLAYGGADTVDGGAGNDVLYGHDGGDSLSGGDGNDILHGGADNGADTLSDGAGNDVLYGGFGADVYIWSGVGNESFTDSGAGDVNILRLPGLNPVDVTCTGNGPYTIGVKGTPHWVQISSGPFSIEFANGVVWTQAQIADIASTGATSAAGGPIVGTTGGESISGTSLGEYVLAYGGADTVDGGDGNDVLYGQQGSDSLTGGAGNDTLYADSGDGLADTLAGGAGNDMLWGGLGVDVYLWGSGQGDDNCVDAAFPTQTNVVRLTNLNPGDITLTGGGWHLITAKATGETLIIQSGPYQVEFANGTVWTSTNINDIASLGATSAPGAPIVGNDTGETLTGTSLGEYILAYGGADTVTGGGGADTLIGGAANDRFVFGSLSDSSTAAQDRISGFAVGDLIDLGGIDADAGTGGDQAFTFIGTSAFSAAGQLRYVYSGGVVTLTGDVDGDGGADFRIDVTGVTSLAGTDFVL